MTVFLFRLLEMSVAGSLLAGLIILWRRFLKKEAVATAFYYMWLLVLLRLSVPFGVTVSLPGVAGPAFESKKEAVVRQEAGEPAASENKMEKGTGAAEPGTAWPAEGIVTVSGNMARSTVGFFSAPAVWMFLWGAGAAIFLMRYVTGYVRFACAVRKHAVDAPQKAWDVLRGLGADERIQLVECAFVTTPMLIGIFRPVIVLPAGIKEEGLLKDIVAHELVHARRHDLLYKWFLAAVTSLHWFNPVMPFLRKEIGRACELACDEAVINGMGEEERKHYGETLLHLAAYTPVSRGLVAMTLCEEKEQLRERLVSIAAYRKKGTGAVLVSLLVAVSLGGCAMVSGVDVPQKVPAEETAATDGTDDNYIIEPGDTGMVEGPVESELQLQLVLLGEKEFFCANGESEPVSMRIDEAQKLFNPDSSYTKIWKFAVVDLDGDGEEEVILRVIDAAGDMGGCLVLHCTKDGEVFGFTLGYQAFEELKTDGTYNDRGGGILDGVCRMRFEGDTCAFDWPVSCTLSSASEGEGLEPAYDYFVNGVPATEEEWGAALDEQSEKENAEWYFYTREAVNTSLATSNITFVYTPDGEEPENEAAEAPGQPEPDLADLYHFPVRVSDTRVLTVALETKEPEKTYFSVERIYVYDGDTLIQTIETAGLTPSENYLWEGLFVNKGHAEGEPDVRDVNFDGAEDFGLLCAASYPKNLPFTYFYWFGAEEKFVQGFTIFGGAALEVDDEQKCLIEHWYDVDGEHTNRYA